jgi:hypothetical protein
MAADNPLAQSRPVDRAALERVLARAAELQSTSSDPGDLAGDLTEAQILDLGKAVGLSPQHLQQALAEERTRVALPPSDRTVGRALFGIASVRASRVIAGVPDKMLSGIDGWMQREECLRVKRHLGDRIVWEPRADLLGNLRRALNIGGRGYALTRAFEVAATVAAVDDTRAVVTLEANLSAHRNQMATMAVVGTGVGAAGSGVLAVLGVFLPVAIVPIAVLPIVSFFTAKREQGRAATRAQLALEQLLDQLERGDLGRQPSILSALAAAATALPRRP